MTRVRLLVVAVLVLAIIGAGAFFVWRSQRPASAPPAQAQPASAPAPQATARITATVFYGSVDGQALIPYRREVELADNVVAQGTHILRAQFDAAPAPLVSVIPKGTTLRSFYVTDRGDAFVDLSPAVMSGHPGGTLMELLTVYAIVNAVTANLPKVQRVQILVNGGEVETLAGHVDLRHPLARDRSLVREK